MNRRERSTVSVGILVILCFLLAACGPEDEPVRAELAPATLRWVTWDLGSQSEAQLVREFQEAYPQIDFERSSQNASTESYVSDQLPPDLLNVDAGWELARLAGKGELADLTELWEASGLVENIPTVLQQVSAFQERQYYIPVSVGWKAIFYNKQIFADYNLSPPETWEDFLAICDTLLANGEIPLSIGASDGWAVHGWFEYLNLRLNGAQFYRDLLAGKERYDDPRVRKVMETWQNLFANGYFIDQRAVSDLGIMTAIIRGDNGQLQGQRAVMALGSTYSYGNLPTPFQAEVDFFRFPIMDSSIPVAEVVEPFGYVMPVGAEHVPSTLAFLEHVSSPQAQLLAAQAPMFTTVHYAPARSDVDSELLDAAQRKALTLIDEADEAVLSFWYSGPPQMGGSVEYLFTSFVRKPEDIDTFLFKVEEIRQKMVDQGLLATE
jgi:ABC-type glycerol-3-phosphate transport system substrate-binding protein